MEKISFMIFLYFLAAQNALAQTTDTMQQPFDLSSPAGWTIEHFPLPPGFAPLFPWKGVEELRLHPGWADSGSEGNWSYVYLWYIDGIVPLDENSLKKNLEVYYDGLSRLLITQKHIPEARLIPAVAAVEKIKVLPGDRQTYMATIRILDFSTVGPIVLNAAIHVLTVPDKNKTAVRLDVSPKPLNRPVWKELEEIKLRFAP
jgi:hypothetical protein